LSQKLHLDATVLHAFRRQGRDADLDATEVPTGAGCVQLLRRHLRQSHQQAVWVCCGRVPAAATHLALDGVMICEQRELLGFAVLAVLDDS
jgi:hypothetical protein